jgi:hypothetical protein
MIVAAYYRKLKKQLRDELESYNNTIYISYKKNPGHFQTR